MSRIVSVWLPQWPVHRWLAAEQRKTRAAERCRPSGAPVAPRIPFVLADTTDAPRIVALNPAAEAYGLAAGETLADARARIGALEVRLAEPEADRKALLRLARWATRYTPSVALFREHSGSDGFFLDVTGATHLMGGEENVLRDLARRLDAFDLPVRLAIAETPGTAWAVSHYARTPVTVVPAGAEGEALGPLPVEALRLAPETARTLRRLGFKRIRALQGQHRAPFAARFEKELLRRLDQAMGRAPEPLVLLTPPPVYVATHSLVEPITTEDAILAVAHRLMQDLAPRLEADGAGARRLRLSLYRVDGGVERLDVALSLPTQSPADVTRLMRLELERTARLLEAGFGFETLSLAVTVAERIETRQHTLATAPEERERARRSTALLDALRQRLGAASVRHLTPVASHCPSRNEMLTAGPSTAAAWSAARPARLRPPLILPRPEPAEVIALLPDGPPMRLRWRGKLFRLAHAEAPERIAPEWWRRKASEPTRDYVLVEDVAGRRFWLYREGIPGRETATPRWFVHGMFA
ncbi:MAG: DNA polymerase Y family protein [Hyphomicrobium sp.]|uniref:Y-family DNA polymerase n=1 Tax=Hyphomicrobium sp. TaxID=82 RepID=UPI003D0DC77D